jgi:hypothetical protein
MADEENTRRNIFDITQYPERTRKIIFGVIVGIAVLIMGAAMFFVSPKNAAEVKEGEPTPSASATQAAVDNESTASPSARQEAVTPKEDLPSQSYDGNYPKNEQEEANAAQQKIIEESLKREKEQTDKVVEDSHEEIAGADGYMTMASKGMLEYCTTNPNETKAEKQARMKPYFHADNPEYRSPQSIFYMQKCSLGGMTDPYTDENKNIVVSVGIAWGAQYQKDGTATTGYTQYRVVLDKDGIVSFDD